MGGSNKEQFYDYQPQMERLPYVTEGTGKPDVGYSDKHTQVMMEDKKKRMDDLREALARLGIVQELAPQGLIPRMPYRPIEQEFGF